MTKKLELQEYDCDFCYELTVYGYLFSVNCFSSLVCQIDRLECQRSRLEHFVQGESGFLLAKLLSLSSSQI